MGPTKQPSSKGGTAVDAPSLMKLRRYQEIAEDGRMATLRWRLVLTTVTLPCALAAQGATPDLNVLPVRATTQLAKSLEAAGAHARHAWRDTPPTNADGTVNAYVEIPRGERRKWEFDMRANARALDRVIPEAVGGYPVNYGFVPQTVSYDGDPFDALVLGPPLEGGEIVRGVVVGFMYMEDEKGIDSKVVLSVSAPDGRLQHALTAADQRAIAEYFRRYKRHEPGGFSDVRGWGAVADGRAHVTRAHTFFRECARHAGEACRVEP
jgi:inorganic pyrophosphatase